jgi:predicted alpha/beta-hydrolase family hydrolase
MGGRIASQVVAAGERADGLAFLAYPLHPPGQFDKRREAHLPSIGAPMLFVQGTRDAFAREDLLLALMERLGHRAELHRVAEADHSFGVLKRTGRTPQDVLAEVRGTLLAWLDRHGL